MLKWILIVIAFEGAEPIASRIFLLDPAQIDTKIQCEAEAQKVRTSAAQQKVEVWTLCAEVKRTGGVVGTEKSS